ncbi:hypothetical protein XELAEV_18006165mg [Xenopus laevis]|uniref:Uncharacterized protein n=1 Tax=Xenopus laevis TaxID=8355 RepID=A0A974DZN0_XENLA|nr:hypothetical protein XELAEV_18006165mg [Xenopus laevis]
MNRGWHQSGRSCVSIKDKILASAARVQMGRRVILKYFIYKHPLKASNAETQTNQTCQDRNYTNLLRVKANSQPVCLKAYTAGNSKACNPMGRFLLSLSLWHAFFILKFSRGRV